MIESLLLTTARISTFFGSQALTVASGFFFQRDETLYLITNRHVLVDQPTGHLPDRIEIEVHTDPDNLTQSTALSVLLYRDGQAIWHQGTDTAGEIDVAAIALDRQALPAAEVLRAFTPAHLQPRLQEVKVGTPLLVVGFPLGFHDTLHHLPVVRQAVVASAFGMRFQGQGYFLTDARTHRGTSGSPVVMRDHSVAEGEALPWRLLGVHSATLDMGSRDLKLDESLGLNCTWYADILMTLSEDAT
jgi:S1-C subfamily serine protease